MTGQGWKLTKEPVRCTLFLSQSNLPDHRSLIYYASEGLVMVKTGSWLQDTALMANTGVIYPFLSYLRVLPGGPYYHILYVTFLSFVTFSQAIHSFCALVWNSYGTPAWYSQSSFIWPKEKQNLKNKGFFQWRTPAEGVEPPIPSWSSLNCTQNLLWLLKVPSTLVSLIHANTKS